MNVSQESPSQTRRRLLSVIARAELHVFEGSHAFEEFDGAGPPPMIPRALAYVRDNEVWSVLAPSADPAQELFQIFSFHFAPQVDNSGFVGWLASHLKATFGTGVFVVCGQNRRRGGIFDYWGCPISLGERIVEEVIRLRQLAS